MTQLAGNVDPRFWLYHAAANAAAAAWRAALWVRLNRQSGPSSSI